MCVRACVRVRVQSYTHLGQMHARRVQGSRDNAPYSSAASVTWFHTDFLCGVFVFSYTPRQEVLAGRVLQACWRHRACLSCAACLSA